jgi:segregation and condensation protein B
MASPDPTDESAPDDGSTYEPDAVRAIEAILMVSDRPVDPNLLAQVTELATERVEEICQHLAESYETGGHGFELVKVAGGYRYQSHPDLSAYVERFVLEGQSSRLSAAALETMAIVAYKQPISRNQVSAIRGVNVDAVVRTLEQRGYIAEVSRDPGPGQAVLFGTTDLFLERLGIDSLADLPPLGDFVPGTDVMEAIERGLRPESTDDTRPTDHREDAGTVASEVDDTTGAEAEAVEDDGGLPDFDTP